jgi:hypothetical protein
MPYDGTDKNPRIHRGFPPDKIRLAHNWDLPQWKYANGSRSGAALLDDDQRADHSVYVWPLARPNKAVHLRRTRQVVGPSSLQQQYGFLSQSRSAGHFELA